MFMDCTEFGYLYMKCLHLYIHIALLFEQKGYIPIIYKII